MSTLNARAATVSAFLVVGIVSVVAGSASVAAVACVIVVQVYFLDVVTGRRDNRGPSREEFFNFPNGSLVRKMARREADVKLDEQRSLFEWATVARHAFAGHKFGAARLNHASSWVSNHEITTVEVLWICISNNYFKYEKAMLHWRAFVGYLQNVSESAQSFRQGNGMHQVKVVALPLKEFVRFLLQNYHHIACFHSRLLVAFPAKEDLLAVLHPFVYVDFEDFCLVLHLLALARFATIALVDHFACRRKIK